MHPESVDEILQAVKEVISEHNLRLRLDDHIASPIYGVSDGVYLVKLKDDQGKLVRVQISIVSFVQRAIRVTVELLKEEVKDPRRKRRGFRVVYSNKSSCASWDSL
jgi:predicted transcriptional regulator